MKTLKVSCYYFQRDSQVNACHHVTFWADGLSCREQFSYKLVTDAVNGRYLGQKYRQLSSLPKVCWIYFYKLQCFWLVLQMKQCPPTGMEYFKLSKLYWTSIIIYWNVRGKTLKKNEATSLVLEWHSISWVWIYSEQTSDFKIRLKTMHQP